MFIILLIPLTIEEGISIQENQGNMALTGVWMDLRQKRNLVYLSFGIMMTSLYIFNGFFLGISIILLLGCLGLFYMTLDKWFLTLN